MRLLLIAIIVVVILVVAALFRPRGGHTVSAQDGTSISLRCPGTPRIERATYGGGGCAAVDVTAAIQSWVDTHANQNLPVSPNLFQNAPACPGAVRTLTVTYSCGAAQDAFRPHRVNTCSSRQDVLPAAMADPDYLLHQWTGQNNENWTVAVTPWDPDSKIQLTAAALTPSTRQMYRPINPLTRIGVTSRVRNWDNPYAGSDISSDPCSDAVSIYQLQPFQPGFLIPHPDDSTDGTRWAGRYYYQPEYWSRASGPYGGPYRPLASCPVLNFPTYSYSAGRTPISLVLPEDKVLVPGLATEGLAPANPWVEEFWLANANQGFADQGFADQGFAEKETFDPKTDPSPHEGEFWWQLAGASPPKLWEAGRQSAPETAGQEIAGRYEQDLAGLVGAGPPGSLSMVTRSEPSFEIPQAT